MIDMGKIEKVREVTASQLAEGYWTFVGGVRIHHAWRVLAKTQQGTYVVEEATERLGPHREAVSDGL